MHQRPVSRQSSGRPCSGMGPPATFRSPLRQPPHQVRTPPCPRAEPTQVRLHSCSFASGAAVRAVLRSEKTQDQGQGRNHKHGTTFGKTGERFPVASQPNFKNHRRHKLNNSATGHKKTDRGSHPKAEVSLSVSATARILKATGEDQRRCLLL